MLFFKYVFFIVLALLSFAITAGIWAGAIDSAGLMAPGRFNFSTIMMSLICIVIFTYWFSRGFFRKVVKGQTLSQSFATLQQFLGILVVTIGGTYGLGAWQKSSLGDDLFNLQVDAASSDEANAKYLLAGRFVTGDGVEKNHKLSEELFSEAAALGHRKSEGGVKGYVNDRLTEIEDQKIKTKAFIAAKEKELGSYKSDLGGYRSEIKKVEARIVSLESQKEAAQIGIEYEKQKINEAERKRVEIDKQINEINEKINSIQSEYE